MAEGFAFLKLEGIDGESQDQDYPDQIQLQSMSFGVSNAGSFGYGTGGGTGKANIQDISCSKFVDKASVRLWQYCATGKHIPSATITLLKQSDETKIDYYKYELTDVMITSYQKSASGGGDLPMESFSLAFAQIKTTYQPQGNTGDATGNVDFGWDLQKAAKV